MIPMSYSSGLAISARKFHTPLPKYDSLLFVCNEAPRHLNEIPALVHPFRLQSISHLGSTGAVLLSIRRPLGQILLFTTIPRASSLP